MSRAPIEKLDAYKRRMGWKFPYVSSFGSDFNFDFGVSFTEEQRRDGAEYNFEPVDFAKVVEDFAKSDSMAEAAASCGTDIAGYVTTEGPGLSAFVLDGGVVVYHTYSCYAPGVEWMLGFSQLLDCAPKERNEGVATRRHDEYEDVGGANPTRA